MSDLANRLETGTSGILATLESFGPSLEAHVPALLAQALGAIQVMQEYLVQSHALLSRVFPNEALPHPTANGTVAISAIAPAIAAASPTDADTAQS